MPSNFARAREHLEQAWLQLSGVDETSVKSRQALDILIEAIATVEYMMPRRKAEIIEFRPAASQP